MTREEVKQLKVVVLGGGWSDERGISMMSASACRDALLEAGFSSVDLLDVASEGFVQSLATGGYDVAFVAMHGRWGEDGCIQGLLEILHMPYTFSGVLASAVGTERTSRRPYIVPLAFRVHVASISRRAPCPPRIELTSLWQSLASPCSSSRLGTARALV